MPEILIRWPCGKTTLVVRTRRSREALQTFKRELTSMIAVAHGTLELEKVLDVTRQLSERNDRHRGTAKAMSRRRSIVTRR